MGHFLLFHATPLKIYKIKTLKKWKRHLEILSFYTCVPKITIIWCMLPEIWSVTDIIFWCFGLFFALITILKIEFEKKYKNIWGYYPFTHVYHKWRSYDVWFLRYKARRAEFFVTLGHFMHFDPPNNPKNLNFEKMKKAPGDVIILHMCTINENHMTYGFWDMDCDRQNIFSFWVILPQLTTRKIKILNKIKKTRGNIIVLHKYTINDNDFVNF